MYVCDCVCMYNMFAQLIYLLLNLLHISGHILYVATRLISSLYLNLLVGVSRLQPVD